MLSYPIPEAEELLTNKLSAAQQSLSNCEEDMDFLREQVTVRYSLPFLPVSHIETSLVCCTPHPCLLFSNPSRLCMNTRLTCFPFC